MAAPVIAEVAIQPEPEEQLPTVAGSPSVLVVDDAPVFLKATGLKLSRAGCTVLAAQDGPDAITIARTSNPDVIILDIGLPADVTVAWDGIRVMKWIKRMENGSAPPIIIVTAGTSAALKQNALDYGATAFFQKPLDHAKLLDAINKIVKQKSSAPGSAAAPKASLSLFTAGN